MASYILNAQTSNTTTARLDRTSPCTLFISGGFGSGTLAIQVAPGKAADALPLTTIDSKTAVGVVNIDVIGTYNISVTLSGATDATLTVLVT